MRTDWLAEAPPSTFAGMAGAIAGGIGALAGLITAVALLVKVAPDLLKALRRTEQKVDEVHKIVNQDKTDRDNWNRELISALRDAGVKVPRDQSKPDREEIPDWSTFFTRDTDAAGNETIRFRSVEHADEFDRLQRRHVARGGKVPLDPTTGRHGITEEI